MFGDSTETDGAYLHTRTDGRLFSLSRLRAKSILREVFIRDNLFADDAVLTTHSKEQLQLLMDNFSKTCRRFGLIIGMKKANGSRC